MRTIQILAALLVVLFIAGCGGSAPSETTDDTNTQAAGEQVQATNEPSKASDQTATKGLKDILVEKIKYKATYKMTSDGETSTVSMAYDWPKIAQRTTVDGVESWTIIDDDVMIACSKEEEWQCFKIGGSEPGEGTASETPASSQTEDLIKEGDVETKLVGSCNVAGEKGTKYEFTYEDYTTSVCYTNDGILLEMTTPESSMVATSVSRSVAASEFVPPAEPQDLSAMIANLPEMPEQ